MVRGEGKFGRAKILRTKCQVSKRQCSCERGGCGMRTGWGSWRGCGREIRCRSASWILPAHLQRVCERFLMGANKTRKALSLENVSNVSIESQVPFFENEVGAAQHRPSRWYGTKDPTRVHILQQ